MLKEPNQGARQKVSKKVGASYLMKKSRCTSTNRIIFQKVFQELLHRKDNEFYCIDSPQLNQQLQQLTGNLPDKYRSALSTPTYATVTALDRKKYINIKGRIQKAIEGLEDKKPNSLKDVFMEKQAILTGFLNELANEMERECRQKADILKYLWNSMVQLLENIAEKLSEKIKHREKKDVEQSLKSHQQYQQLIDGYRQKQEQLSEKSHVQRMTIDSLIYELRFKRKEVNKLYRNQKLLINKLNDFKIENLNIQNNYLDLLSSQDLPQSQSKIILQAKDQVRKNMFSKFTVAGNKKQNKKQISEELELRTTKIQDLQNLYEQIKSIAGTTLGSPHKMSSLIEASIDNFGLKHDDRFTPQSKILSIPQKIARLNAQTQTNNTFRKSNQEQKLSVSTQFGYYDKLTQQLINNKGTQSYFQYPKKIKTDVYQTQVNQLQLLTYRKTRENNIIRVINETIFGVNEMKPNNFIKVNVCVSPKNHKKNYSDLQVNSPSTREFPMSDFMEDYIQQKQYQNTDSQLTQQHDIKKRRPLKKNSIKYTKQNNSASISPALSKQRYSTLTSKQAFNRSNQDGIKTKKSNFAPQNLQKDLSSPQIKINFVNNRISSGSKPERLSRDTAKKSVTQKYQKNYDRQDISKNGFLQKNNYFNIEIDAEKQAAILKMFLNKQYSTVGVDDMQDIINQSDNQDALTHQKSNSIQLQGLLGKQQSDSIGFKRTNKRKQTNLCSSQTRIKSKRYSDTSKYKDENDMILNLCRSNYQKGHKKIKQKIGIFKYQDQFTSVKDKIQFIARDVKELVKNKENLLKKTINNKNIKSTYKILMMTFSKAYDAYNKGILRGNLIYPLFQSFALVYGAINNNQIYKKMINFVAALCVNKENTILRFFLFFLGLDSSSKYSEKVTISEVYLCLKLLQKISVDGKVTLNIQSIYTDTSKIKEQLMNILKQQNIPELLSQSIQRRVTKQLQSSALYQSSTSQSHLKLNIYNIILLIIQQVIKCKNTLKQTLIPIFMKYQIYQKEMKLPISLIQVILQGWKSPNYDPNKLKSLILIISNSGKRETVTVQQFCSILFESNLVNIDQLFLKSDFIFRKNWKIPLGYLQEIQYKMLNKKYDSEVQKRQIQLFFQISSPNNRGQFVEQNQTIYKIKRIIFQRHYERKISQLAQSLLGQLLICCN